MRLLTCLLSALIWSCRSWKAGAQFTADGRSAHINEGNFSKRDHVKPLQPQQALDLVSGSNFNLKVQVNDALSRQQLSQSVVEVYVNYTRTNTALTGEDGSVLLHVPYQTGTPITIVASKQGYLNTLLPCETNRTPIFSSVTMSLLGLNEGNIWLFEDSVLITGKTSDASSRPIVQFPKSLLNLTDSSDVTSVKAYLNIPKLPSEEDSFMLSSTLGIMSSKSGYVSVELSPVAAVNVQLFSGDTELHVKGPIQISLSIPESHGMTTNVVPAWFLNQTTGGWMRKGLGTVVSDEGKLLWTFTAPHLGYWIAAPLSPPRGFFGLADTIDFILRYSSFLMVILGGFLVIVICLLTGFMFFRRSSPSETTTKKIRPGMRKDQTTSTCDDEVSLEDFSNPQDELNQSFTERGDQHNACVYSMHNGHNGGVLASDVVAIAVDCNELEPNSELSELTCLLKGTGQFKFPSSLSEEFFCNQPVAIFPAAAFLHLEGQFEQPPWGKFATLPRAGSSNSAATGPPSTDSFTQTRPTGVQATQKQAEEDEGQVYQEATSTNTSGDHLSLPESVSVPGTLSKVGGSRHSVPALAELSQIPSLQPPRAWFVTLEGKPAAEMHYAVSDQRRRRPVESRETSLDSGVDMSEQPSIQTSGRRTVTLERNATFVKSSSSRTHAPPQ